MKARILLFLLWYTLFYWWLNISWVRPVTLLQYQRGLYWNLRDYLLWMVIALIPYLMLLKYYPNRKLRGMLLIIISLTAIHYLRLNIVYAYRFPWVAYIMKNAHLFFSVPLFGFTFYFIRHGQYKQLREKKLLKDARQSELDFLRLQINPHFLFNSLNNIYGLVYENAPNARDAIRSLSRLIHYSYQDMNRSKKVSLQNELQCIRQYIALQELRYAVDLNVLLEIKDPPETVMIPPMLLIPFVENAFKHGDFSTGPLEIRVHTDNRQMQFYCSNPKKTDGCKKKAGIGLQNVRRRLVLIYGRHHELKIRETRTQFFVYLKVNHEINDQR